MSKFLKRFLQSVFGLVVLLLVGAAAWLGFSPPELLRVGTGYAAKIVCSNVFIAKRDANAVLADDVQAPGNPLLKFLNVAMDDNTNTVTVRIFGFFAPSKAVFLPGQGCANIQSTDSRSIVSDEAASAAAPSLDIAISAKVQSVIEDKELAGSGMRAVAVIHNGQLVAETYGEGFNADTPLLGWSMTKSVMATLMGMRVAENHMDLGKSNLLPQWQKDERAKITVANLMAMESGLRFNENYGTVADVTRMLFLEKDMAGFAASLPLEAQPGTKFNYSSGTANILSKLFMESFDDRNEALVYPRIALFEPLGMTSAILETDASGVFAGSSSMYATARDWAKLGAFLADGAKLDGKEVLPADFVSFMRKPSSASGGRYGSAQVWLRAGGAKAGEGSIPDDAFWMSGHDGQTVMIVPSMHLAVVRLGLTPTRSGYSVQNLDARVVEALR
jgi:CubicO group peptidase (beta-lactamase class C family)